jgi:hypothetical protein
MLDSLAVKLRGQRQGLEGSFLRGLCHGVALAVLLWAVLALAAWSYFG